MPKGVFSKTSNLSPSGFSYGAISGNKIQPSYMAVGPGFAKYFVRIKISKNFCGIFGVEVMLHGVHPCICCFLACFDLTIGMI